MRFKVKKVGSILCTASCLVSLSGCFLIPGTKYLTYDQVSEELRKEITVKDWDGSIPEGMEVRYVVSRELSKNDSGTVIDYRYEYDDKGRQTAVISVDEKYSVRESLTYNDDGTIAVKEHKTTGKITGYHIHDFMVDFDYNDKGKLISCARTTFSDEGEVDDTSVDEYEYENGHLVRAGNATYDYNDDTAPYYEYCADVSDSFSSGDVKIVKRFYDENRLLITEEYISSEITYNYVYENGVLTGITKTDKWGYCSEYDAEDNLLTETDIDGNLIIRNTRNGKGDRTCYEEWRDGKPRCKNTYTYVYDEKGNKLSEETEFWSVDGDGKESSFKSIDTYEYDEHGLLTAEYVMIEGRFSRMKVYSYEAILVPAG